MSTPPIMDRITVIDSHTAGEPTRVVVAGGPDLGRGSMAERAAILRDHHRGFWRSVVSEPRGSDVLVAALVCEPVDPGAVCGVIFWNPAGMLGMCGHGTIGLVASLAHLGRIRPGVHRIETHVGDVTATLHPDGRVSVQNVLSYRTRTGVIADGLTGDVAWGGNWFFLAEAFGPVGLTDVEALTARCWAVRRALAAAGFPEIDHIELCGPPGDPANDGRNFVLCPGGAYDRSPCGTGTSAKLACLAADGDLAPGEVWRQEGVCGGVFEGSYESVAGGIMPTITGRAWVTAEATLLRAADDPCRDGMI